MTDIPTGKQRRAVYLFVRSNPGCTSNEAAAGLPDENPTSIGATLSHLHRDGFLSRQRKGLGFRYFIAERGTATVAAEPLGDWDRFDELKLRRAENELFEASARAEAAQEAHAQEALRLQARIHHLEQWRNAAIARYPDLDVDPALLAKAREIVMRASDITTALADDILAGEWDHTPIMKATLEALGSSVL